MNEALNKARAFAAEAHHGQVYGEDQPYTVHLEAVLEVLQRFEVGRPALLTAALLHDTLEDTSVNYHTLKTEFGEGVAELVYAVTDELGRNRRERWQKTSPKIAANPEAILLKLADRIANVEADGMSSMYRREFPVFHSALHPHSPSEAAPMWEHLEALLKGGVEDLRGMAKRANFSREYQPQGVGGGK